MQLRTTSFRFGPLRAPAILNRLRYSALPEPELEHRSAASVHQITPRDTDFRDMSFTFAAIALCAKVAFADGRLSREKYVAFRAAFPLSGGLCPKLRKLFLLACKNPTPFEHYTTQVKHMFPARRDVFSSLLDRLFSIATADGELSREADLLLARIGRALGLSSHEYTSLRERNLSRRPQDILGVDKKTSARQLKKHYHNLMRRWHPDRYAAHDLSPEVNLLLQLKVSEINGAYAALSRKAA